MNNMRVTVVLCGVAILVTGIGVASRHFLSRPDDRLSRARIDPMDTSESTSIEGPAVQSPGASLPDSRSEVSQQAFSGKVRIGSPRDYVRYQGGGTLVISNSGSHDRVKVRVEAGVFSLFGPRDVGAEVQEARLDGHLVEIIAGQDLEPGQGNVLYCEWGIRSLEVSVRDAYSDGELDGIDVWRVSRAKHRQEDPFFLPAPVIAPDPGDALFVENAQSPLTLTISDDGPCRLWFVCEGYAPFQYRYPEGLPRKRLVVHLRPAGSITVEAEGVEVEPSSWSVGLYEVDDHGRPRSFAPISRYPAKPETRITELPMRLFHVTLEHRAPGSELFLVMDEEGAELRPGVQEVIQLEAGDHANAEMLGRISFHFPEAADGQESQVSGRIVPASINARRLYPEVDPRPTPLARGQILGPLDLSVGDYYLDVQPDNISLAFSIQSGQDQLIDVPCRPPQDLILTIVDASTGDYVTPQVVSWSAPMDLAGNYHPQGRSKERTLVDLEAPIPLRAPLAEILITIQARGYGLTRSYIDLREGIDPVVMLNPLSCLEVELRDLDDILTIGWLESFEIRGGEELFAIESVGITVRDETQIGQIHFDGQGKVDVTFPPLPSHGSVLARSVEIEAGSRTNLAVVANDILQ